MLSCSASYCEVVQASGPGGVNRYAKVGNLKIALFMVRSNWRNFLSCVSGMEANGM